MHSLILNYMFLCSWFNLSSGPQGKRLRWSHICPRTSSFSWHAMVRAGFEVETVGHLTVFPFWSQLSDRLCHMSNLWTVLWFLIKWKKSQIKKLCNFHGSDLIWFAVWYNTIFFYIKREAHLEGSVTYFEWEHSWMTFNKLYFICLKNHHKRPWLLCIPCEHENLITG